jgi:hypothetical protein
MGNYQASFKICPSCNYFCQKSEHNEFCPYCGEKLIDQCPVCGAKITIPYANFCPVCGNSYPGRKIVNSKS